MSNWGWRMQYDEHLWVKTEVREANEKTVERGAAENETEIREADMT